MESVVNGKYSAVQRVADGNTPKVRNLRLACPRGDESPRYTAAPDKSG